MAEDQRNATIRALHQIGKSVSTLARLYGVSRQRIDQIINHPPVRLPSQGAHPRAYGARPAFPKRRRDVAVIYFVGVLGYVKIGIALDLERRLNALRAGCPVPLTLLATFPGTMQDEYDLHQRFAHLNYHHEWFHHTAEIDQFLVELPKRPTTGSSSLTDLEKVG